MKGFVVDYLNVMVYEDIYCVFVWIKIKKDIRQDFLIIDRWYIDY